MRIMNMIKKLLISLFFYLSACSQQNTRYVAFTTPDGIAMSSACSNIRYANCGVTLYNCDGQVEFICLTNVAIIKTGETKK